MSIIFKSIVISKYHINTRNKYKVKQFADITVYAKRNALPRIMKLNVPNNNGECAVTMTI
jgi:hypothetical protein